MRQGIKTTVKRKSTTAPMSRSEAGRKGAEARWGKSSTRTHAKPGQTKTVSRGAVSSRSAHSSVTGQHAGRKGAVSTRKVAVQRTTSSFGRAVPKGKTTRQVKGRVTSAQNKNTVKHGVAKTAQSQSRRQPIGRSTTVARNVGASRTTAQRIATPSRSIAVVRRSKAQTQRRVLSRI